MGAVFALAAARASVTVSWNVAAHAPAQRSVSAAVRTAVVERVRGNELLLRLRGGVARTYVTTPQQARLLEKMLGETIRFRAP